MPPIYHDFKTSPRLQYIPDQSICLHRMRWQYSSVHKLRMHGSLSLCCILFIHQQSIVVRNVLLLYACPSFCMSLPLTQMNVLDHCIISVCFYLWVQHNRYILNERRSFIPIVCRDLLFVAERFPVITLSAERSWGPLPSHIRQT
jgi:hypothetical protein